MARRPPSRGRKKRKPATAPKGAAPRRLSRSAIALVLALAVLGIAVLLLMPSAPQQTQGDVQAGAPTPIIAQTAPSVPVTPSPTPEPEAPQPQTSTAEVPEEVPLEPEAAQKGFTIPVSRSHFTEDPMGYYLQLARPRPSKRSEPQPTVSLPTFEEPPEAPWIEKWVDEVRFQYVAYVAGERPGAVVMTRDGEIVVFAGSFPGTPEVRIVRITPVALTLSAKGHTMEVKK